MKIIDVIENEEQELLPVTAIRAQLDSICAIANKAENTFEVGYFTCTNRDDWADNYQNLEKAEKWFLGHYKVKQRSKKSLYLSSVRSMLFNELPMVACRKL